MEYGRPHQVYAPPGTVVSLQAAIAGFGNASVFSVTVAPCRYLEASN